MPFEDVPHYVNFTNVADVVEFILLEFPSAIVGKELPEIGEIVRDFLRAMHGHSFQGRPEYVDDFEDARLHGCIARNCASTRFWWKCSESGR